VTPGNDEPGAWPVVGHDWAIQLLQAGLDAGRLPHALLLAGPPHVGKTTLALTVAKAMNCQGQPRPCGQCRSCRRIAHGNHPDVRIVTAEPGKEGRDGILKIDQIRALQREAALAPMESSHKVFLLREVERANLPAANALLKTLEEPPSQVVLLQTSARPHALLPTIISRCQVLQLRPTPLPEISQALQERWGATADEADLLARLSGGRLGWAVQRLNNAATWEERTYRLAQVQELAEQGHLARLKVAAGLSRTPQAVLPTLELWAAWWRDVLLLQWGCGEFITNVDQGQDLRVQASRFDPFHVRAFLARLQAAPMQLRRNVNARLLLETLLLHMPTPMVPA
jgi:DNA polymerase-3 subunit delta'